MCFSSPCILADLPRLATGTKRTRLRLKQLFVLSSASPGRCPAADARDRQPLEGFSIQRSLPNLKQHCFLTATLHDISKARSRGGAAITAKHLKKIGGNLSNRWRKPVCMTTHSTPTALRIYWSPASTGYTGGYSYSSPSDFVLT